MCGKDLFLWKNSPHSAAGLQELDPGCTSLGMKQPHETALPKSCNLAFQDEFKKFKNRLETGCNWGIWGSKANPCPQWDWDWFAPAIPEQGLGTARSEVAGWVSPSGKDGDVAKRGNTLAGRCFPSPLLCKPWADELWLRQGAWGEPRHRPLCQKTCHNREA